MYMYQNTMHISSAPCIVSNKRGFFLVTCAGVAGFECNDRSATDGLSEYCSRDILECQCVTGFRGDACEDFYCGDGSDPACSGHGTCILEDTLNAVRHCFMVFS